MMLSIGMQFMLDEEKLPFLHSAKTAWHHRCPAWQIVVVERSVLTEINEDVMLCYGTLLAKCVRNRWLNALFPFLALFGAHIL